MFKKYREPWLAALRSGNFKQGRNCLRQNGRHCCLGVLCETIKNDKFTWDRDSFGNDQVSDDCELIEEIADLVGLQPEEEEFLIMLNDDNEYSFEQIADYIEKNL